MELITLAADHQAVATVQPPNPAAGAHIQVMDGLAAQLAAASDVIVIMGITSVNQDVPRAQQRYDIGDDPFNGSGRDHQPDYTRQRQERNKFGQRRGSHGAQTEQWFDG